MYPIAVQATGATGVVTPALPPDSAMPLGHDLAAMARAITPRTRVVFIANPNNPTGTWVPARGAEGLHRRRAAPRDGGARRGVLRIHRRPADCRTASTGSRRYPNLVVFRTFSKAYGLAGVRVGYAVSHPSVADMLNRVRQAVQCVGRGPRRRGGGARRPGSCGRRGQGGGRRTRARGGASRRSGGTRVVPSAGNFLLLHAGAECARQRFDALLRQGIIVRPVGNYRLPEHLRVTLGTRRAERSFPQRLGSLIASR